MLPRDIEDSIGLVLHNVSFGEFLVWFYSAFFILKFLLWKLFMIWQKVLTNIKSRIIFSIFSFKTCIKSLEFFFLVKIQTKPDWSLQKLPLCNLWASLLQMWPIFFQAELSADHPSLEVPFLAPPSEIRTLSEKRCH